MGKNFMHVHACAATVQRLDRVFVANDGMAYRKINQCRREFAVQQPK